MEYIKDFLNKTNCILTEYDDKQVRRLIRKINLVNAKKIEVVFKLGSTVKKSFQKCKT